MDKKTKYDETIQVKNKIEYFLSPEYILIPYTKGYDLMVMSNQKIFKQQPILGKNLIKISSPISGEVICSKVAKTITGEEIKTIVIENDYKEKLETRKGSKKKLNNLTKDSFILKLKEKGILNNLDSKMYLYESFEKCEYPKNIIISAVDIDKNFYNNAFYLKEYKDIILETLDILIETFKLDTCYLVLANNDNDNIINYSDSLGTYPKIKMKLVDPCFPNGLEVAIRAGIKSTNYYQTIFLTLSDTVSIYNALKKDQTTTDKLITITGPCVKNPMVIKCKTNSYIKPILKNLINLKECDNYYYCLNNNKNYITESADDYIITSELEGVYITNYIDTTKRKCSNCKKCFKSCPVGLDPKYLMKNYKNQKKLKAANIQKCLNCNICTQICPSNIDLKENLR